MTVMPSGRTVRRALRECSQPDSWVQQVQQFVVLGLGSVVDLIDEQNPSPSFEVPQLGIVERQCDLQEKATESPRL